MWPAKAFLVARGNIQEKSCLTVCTLEAIIKSSENFSGDLAVNQRLRHLQITWRAKGKHFEKLKF